MPRATIALSVTVLVLLAGCAEGEPETADSARTTTVAADPEGTTAAPGGEVGGELSAYGLALLAAPVEATHVTITDYDAIRARLGVPDLSSQDIMTDRLEFWRAAEASSVLLTDGLLREENSRYDLTYDFTQDDVDAEVRWTGPQASGFLLALRPDLDLDLVQAAIDDEAPGLEGALLDRATSSVRTDGGDGAVWATSSSSAVTDVADVAAESVLVRNGCVPFADALGVDATIEDQEAVLAAHDVEGLLDVQAVAIAFAGQTATVRLAYPDGAGEAEMEEDLAARLALAQDWPATETIGFADGFGQGSVTGTDGRVGELSYAVTNPGAAANLALADLVPLGVCTDVEWLEEPTGL